MKTSYLDHFHKPRLDLLVYTLVQKLAPLYYSKLEFANITIGRYRKLAPWRKDFKSAWMDDLKKDQNVDLHDKYRPDPQHWVCTWFSEKNANRVGKNIVTKCQYCW